MEKIVLLDKLRELKVLLKSDALNKEEALLEFQKLIEGYFKNTANNDLQLIELKDTLNIFLKLEYLRESNRILKAENDLLKAHLG